jgi:DNA replication and repair protein RecF
MPPAPIRKLDLVDFRSYERLALDCGEGAVFLHGRNGAGKTNVLEAISWLAPGRGLRGATAAEAGRRAPGEAKGRPFTVSAVVGAGDDEDGVRLGTAVDPASGRRFVRVEGENVTPGRLLEHVRLVWLTPQQDRLFLEGGTERRRFLDRLVFADRPRHAADVAAYEKAMRERMRLLTGERAADPVWLEGLEVQAAEAGARRAIGRAATLSALSREIAARAGRPFPTAELALRGPAEEAAGQGRDEADIAALLRDGLAAARARDAGAGRALFGPHRADLVVIHAEKGRPAAETSTGEQKALILNLILAQAARLARDPQAPAPVLLLDEVAAHLDPGRRAALYEELAALRLQAFLTGVERGLFEGLSGARGFAVEDGMLTPG